jgi:hypothetical protein
MLNDTAANFNSKDVLTATTVTATGLSLSGAAASDYELTSTSAQASASITPAPLTVTTTSETITLGGPPPVFTGSNNLFAQDVPFISWSYAPVGYSGAVGSYPIDATATDPRDLLANYTVTTIEGNFSVLQSAAAQIPDTVVVNSQLPQTVTTSYSSPDDIPISNGGDPSVPGLIYTASGESTSAHIGLDLEMSPALQQQLGY